MKVVRNCAHSGCLHLSVGEQGTSG